MAHINLGKYIAFLNTHCTRPRRRRFIPLRRCPAKAITKEALTYSLVVREESPFHEPMILAANFKLGVMQNVHVDGVENL